LKQVKVAGTIVTANAMGCQTNIARFIRKRKADYMLALKGNQGTFHEDVRQYSDDPQLQSLCAYHKATEKAHSAVETREYWQSGDIPLRINRRFLSFPLNRFLYIFDLTRFARLSGT
jgi:predicted transposase YbfD/YdcC